MEWPIRGGVATTEIFPASIGESGRHPWRVADGDAFGHHARVRREEVRLELAVDLDRTADTRGQNPNEGSLKVAGVHGRNESGERPKRADQNRGRNDQTRAE